MQTAPTGTYSGMVGCAGDIIKNEGPLAFYKVKQKGSSPVLHAAILTHFFPSLLGRKKGTLTPLLGIGLCVAIQFGALEATKRRMAEANLAAGKGGEGGATLSGPQLATAGAIAGLANGVVSGPVEHIRIRESNIYMNPRFVPLCLTSPTHQPRPTNAGG